MIRFTAHCARDHDRVDFTDPKAFEAHCTTVHKARKIAGGGPAWCSPKPHAWKAPKAPTDTVKLTAALVKWDDNGPNVKWRQGGVLDFHTDDVVTPDRLEAGDTFQVKSTEYRALETDPERGVRVQLGTDESKVRWLSLESLTAQVARITGGDTVTIVKRAA